MENTREIPRVKFKLMKDTIEDFTMNETNLVLQKLDEDEQYSPRFPLETSSFQQRPSKARDCTAMSGSHDFKKCEVRNLKLKHPINTRFPNIIAKL